METFANFITTFTLIALIFLTAAVIYEGVIAVAQTVKFARSSSPAVENLVTAPALPPVLEMPLEMPVTVSDIPNADPIETRPTPVLATTEPVPTPPEVHQVEDDREDSPSAIEFPDFHSMNVRELRGYCKSENITGYSKYAKAGKQALADWLEVRALGELGRANAENLRDRHPEGSQTWHALNDIAQTL